MFKFGSSLLQMGRKPLQDIPLRVGRCGAWARAWVDRGGLGRAPRPWVSASPAQAQALLAADPGKGGGLGWALIIHGLDDLVTQSH